ncbi:MAG: hypothetical protein J5J06_10420 [Phycisphaerae bacterium]|nr:hypothetical protein [Phycisphaerae bacterium]
MKKVLIATLAVLFVVGFFAAPGMSKGKPTPIGGGDCPDFTVLCPQVYDPVLCDDGNVYYNLCAATYHYCATGCVSTGGGPIEVQ